MRDLLELRNEIDDIDNKIVELYEKRMHISTEVAEYKIQTGKKVFDKEREDSKLNTLESKASTSFTKRGIRELFEHIMSMSRKKQYQLLADTGVTSDENFEQVDKLDFTNANIVFQGVEGAYSQQATKEYFGENCDCYNVETWKDAMEAIKNNEADYAVLPIENSSAGIVSENYDLLVEYNNYIVAEQIIKIDHCLLALKGAELEDIKTVYSHPQALMQCSKYLDSHRDWDRLSVKNTAFSAQKIREDGLCNQAAIASSITADIYGLQIIDSAIQNNKNNSTRFIIVTNKKMYDKNATKMSICFEIPHKSGSLYNILSHFIFNNVNMTNIQSRPIPGRNWEYRFFVDFEGNFTDTGVVNALRGLKEETISLKILGTY